MTSCRARASPAFLSGLCSQRRMVLLPMEVLQLSSTEINVGPSSPLSVSLISRLRRVAASRAMKLESLSSTKGRM